MPNVIERIADSLSHFGVRLSYGDQVATANGWLMPVALVTSGFGGGGDESENGGGSAGGLIIPIGAYVSNESGVMFEPNTVALIAVSVPAIAATGWSIAKIAKALR